MDLGFRTALRQADEESRCHPGGSGRVLVVMVTAAVCLTLHRYLGLREGHALVAHWLAQLGLSDAANGLLAVMNDGPDWLLNQLTWWAVGCAVTYFVIPALVIRIGFRERLGDYGMKLNGALTGWWIYLVMLALVLPLVAWMSADEVFQETYPFYRHVPGRPLWPNLLRWELLYASQFIFLEFFFRGFILHGLRPRLGSAAIPVMMLPYCMIHFTKPLPEACASIVAGLALGLMSLKTRSIWLGAALHITVALSMDLASLARQGFLG